MQSVSVDGSETYRCVCEVNAIAALYYNLRNRLSANGERLNTRRAPIALRPGGAVTGVKVPLAFSPPSP